MNQILSDTELSALAGIPQGPPREWATVWAIAGKIDPETHRLDIEARGVNPAHKHAFMEHSLKPVYLYSLLTADGGRARPDLRVVTSHRSKKPWPESTLAAFPLTGWPRKKRPRPGKPSRRASAPNSKRRPARSRPRRRRSRLHCSPGSEDAKWPKKNSPR